MTPFWAVPDPYALYGIALGHTPPAAALRERLVAGGEPGPGAGPSASGLVVTGLTLMSAVALADCGELRCPAEHPDGVADLVQQLCALGRVRYAELPTGLAMSAGRLYREQAGHRYLGDTVVAACAAAVLAQSEHLPVLTTPRARYCYATGVLDPVAKRIEL